MNNEIKKILSLLFTGCLLGCASTLTRHECLEADWYEIGLIDGSEGEPRAKFQEHAENCLKYDVQVGREAYYRGRDQGLRVYCTQDRGFDLGRLGERYNPICPQDLEADFLAGYTKGQGQYDSESKITTLEQRLQRLETQIKSKKKQLLGSDLNQDRKAELKADINYLDVELRHTLRDLQQLKNRDPSE
ncbi:MAG: DUF2799 domain-containing protein [Desulfobacterales bacterium]